MDTREAPSGKQGGKRSQATRSFPHEVKAWDDRAGGPSSSVDGGLLGVCAFGGKSLLLNTGSHHIIIFM